MISSTTSPSPGAVWTANKPSQASAIDQHHNALIKSDLATDKNTLSGAPQTPLCLDTLTPPAHASRLDTHDLRLLIRAALWVSENTPNSTALKVTTTAHGKLDTGDAIDPLSRTQAIQALLINHDLTGPRHLRHPTRQATPDSLQSIPPRPRRPRDMSAIRRNRRMATPASRPPTTTDTGDRRMPFLNGCG